MYYVMRSAALLNGRNIKEPDDDDDEYHTITSKCLKFAKHSKIIRLLKEAQAMRAIL